MYYQIRMFIAMSKTSSLSMTTSVNLTLLRKKDGVELAHDHLEKHKQTKQFFSKSNRIRRIVKVEKNINMSREQLNVAVL